MDTGNLVDMVNRIGMFFESTPDESEALLGVKDHLCKYWPPLMRRRLLALATSDEAQSLHRLVKRAIERHAEELRPRQDGCVEQAHGASHS